MGVKRKKHCLCQGIRCENRASGDMAVDYEVCQLCQYEFTLLAPYVAETSDESPFWVECSKRKIQEVENKDKEVVYAILRGICHMCLYNNEMTISDAYELICTFVPMTAADVFDYNMKERTGGGVYPSLRERLASVAAS